jgi:hypothetical protein
MRTKHFAAPVLYGPTPMLIGHVITYQSYTLKDLQSSVTLAHTTARTIRIHPARFEPSGGEEKSAFQTVLYMIPP